MKKLIFVLTLAVFLGAVLGFDSGGAQEGPITAKILRVPRPNVVVAEVCCGARVFQTRIRLAGVNPPLGLPGVYQEGQQVLRKMIANREVYFDFALGFGPDDSIWTGYLYLPCQCEDDEDWIIVNAEMIRLGWAEVDVKTAGENQLVYLQSLEDEARENLLGIWREQERMTQATRSRDDDDCPECFR